MFSTRDEKQHSPSVNGTWEDGQTFTPCGLCLVGYHSLQLVHIGFVSSTHARLALTQAEQQVQVEFVPRHKRLQRQ